MPDISLLEASQRYGVNERVLRRWIKAGWLEARKIMVSGRLQYAIDQNALESVLQSRNVGHVRSDPVPSDNERIADLEQRVSDLEGHIYALREAIASLRYQDGPPTPPPQKIARIASVPTKKPTPRSSANPIPDGYVSFYAFNHGVSDGTSSRWKENHLEYVQKGSWNSEGGQHVKVILSQEGQRAFHDFATVQKKGYKPCVFCPYCQKHVE